MLEEFEKQLSKSSFCSLRIPFHDQSTKRKVKFKGELPDEAVFVKANQSNRVISTDQRKHVTQAQLVNSPTEVKGKKSEVRRSGNDLVVSRCLSLGGSGVRYFRENRWERCKRGRFGKAIVG